MKNRLTLPIYALTLLLSAFLIFSLQPLFSKMILPLLGGSSSVWNTAMVFFQAMLLLGYGYAHLITNYLKPKQQVILHILLLIIFSIFLPLSVGENPNPSGSDPIVWQLTVMLTAIGGPFFILSSSAPLLQKWFAASNHERSANPYFLYAVSNIGSMGSLLAYPFLLEPLSTLTQQRYLWAIGYGALIILTVCAASFFWNSYTKTEVVKDEGARPNWQQELSWIGFAFIPSSLMLGFTTLITTDLASAPLFWVVPLVLYLLTFIIAFSERTLICDKKLRRLTIYALSMTMLFLMTTFALPKLAMVGSYLIIFFILAQYCHSRLATNQPSLKYLTVYYFYISLGGVLGGIFNALIAPSLFIIPAELSLPLVMIVWTLVSAKDFKALENLNIGIKSSLFLIAPIFCGYTVYVADSAVNLVTGVILLCALVYFTKYLVLFAWSISIAFLLFPPIGWSFDQDVVLRARNYFGILTVWDGKAMRTFKHGGTIHGAQPKKPELRLTPITYYHPDGPIGDVFKVLSSETGPQEVAVLGLGVGSVACYRALDRSFDFYEIDPEVVKIAQDPQYFTYLSDCGSPYKIVLGDARLKIMEAPTKKYDLIIVDTFSSDNIPVHIMTKEAFRIYLDKLKDDGVIAMNISNRYLDLRPILASIARDLGVTMQVKVDRKELNIDEDIPYLTSVYVVFTKSPDRTARFKALFQWDSFEGELSKSWTDDYANILGAFGVIR